MVSGGLSVVHPGKSGERALQRFAAGEFFISRFLLTGTPATVDLVAEEETVTLALEAIHVIDFLNRNPALARRLEQAIDTIDTGLKSSNAA